MMTRTTDTVITTNDNLAETINALPAGSTIELAEGNHALTAPLVLKDGMMLFSRERGKAQIVCEDTTGYHQINGNAKNPTLANIAFSGYDSRKDTSFTSSPKQRAFINGWGGWVSGSILHCDMASIYPRAVSISSGMRIYDSRFMFIGVLAVGGVETANIDVVIDNCQFNNNDTSGDGKDMAEQGAMKLVNLQNGVVQNCYIHDDTGGIWIDAGRTQDNRNITIKDNLIVNVSRPGIHYEISFDGLITRNRIRGCGYGKNNWGWGSQILVSSSRDCIVYKNIVDCVGEGDKWGNGITVVNQDREPYALNNLVYSNDIIYAKGSRSGIYDDTGAFSNGYKGDNKFIDNREYVFGQTVPDDLKFPDDWKLNNDFVPPREKPPIIIDPPQKPPTKKTYIVTVEETTS